MRHISDNLINEAEIFTQEFINSFSLRFGVLPRITYNLYDHAIPKMTLMELEGIANAVLWTYAEKSEFPLGIRTHVRKRMVVIHRYAIFLHAIRMGYTLETIGEYFGYDHATVLHAKRSIPDLIDSKDKLTLDIVDTLKNKLKNRYGYDGTIQSNTPEGVNS